MELSICGAPDGHQAVLLDEVHCHFADSGPSDDDCCAGVGQRLDELPQLVLLGAAVVCELLGVLDEYRALSKQQPALDELLQLYDYCTILLGQILWSVSPPTSSQQPNHLQLDSRKQGETPPISILRLFSMLCCGS